MMFKPLSRIIPIILLAITSSIAYASENKDDAASWLIRMSQAMNTKSYSGTFVYQSLGLPMVAMKILRVNDENGPRERLILLNGGQGEVIRNHDGVTCKLPNSNPLVMDRRGVKKVFPPRGLNVLKQASGLYLLSMKPAHQVAGRHARLIEIIPTDNLRYGYRVWLDEETGLLLRSQLIGTLGKILEQLMYTSIDIYDDAPDILNREIPVQAVADDQNNSIEFAKPTESDDHTWQVNNPPKGFALAERNKESFQKHKQLEHLVYTDGLASVSVFIEKGNDQPSFNGESHMGGITAYSSVVDKHRVTVVGEVPIETLKMMSSAVRYTAADLHR